MGQTALALILGGAQCVHSDAERAQQLGPVTAYIAVNDMIAVWPGRIDYAVTLHPEKLRCWISQRRDNGYAMSFQTWSYNRGPLRASPQIEGIDRITDEWAGSSGLFAVKVAREEGLNRIILCGVPMSVNLGHVVRDKAWPEADLYHNAWRTRFAEIAPYVRSMSGWTQEILGSPEPEWLRG